MSYQSSRYCFTLNNYTEEQRTPPEWIKTITTGGVWGREIGDNGTPHIQGFMALKKKSTITGVRKHFPSGFSMHLEACKGNAQQTINYCTKGEDYETWGELPSDKKQNKQESELDTLDEAYNLIKEGREEEIRGGLKIKYAYGLEKVSKKARHVPKALDKYCGLWIWGIAGAGKSRLARTFGDDLFNKPHGQWWDGYNGESIVLIDDLHIRQARGMVTHLKIWADMYPFTGMVKGSSTGIIRPSKLIITSQYSIEEMYPDPREYDAIARRFDVIHMPNKWVDQDAQNVLNNVESDIPLIEEDE